MAQAEGSIGASSIDLISTDHFRVVPMTASIGPCLGFQVFSFVVGVKAESIQERKALTCHRDGDLCSKLNIAPCLATHDRPDMSLAKANDAVRNTSAVRLVKNGLLTDQLADNQQLLVGISPSRQKACTTGDQGINGFQITLQIVKLPLDRSLESSPSWSFLLLLCRSLAAKATFRKCARALLR